MHATARAPSASRTAQILHLVGRSAHGIMQCIWRANTLLTRFSLLSTAVQHAARVPPAVASASLRCSSEQSPLLRNLSQVQLSRQLAGTSLRSPSHSMASIRPGTARQQTMQIRCSAPRQDSPWFTVQRSNAWRVHAPGVPAQHSNMSRCCAPRLHASRIVQRRTVTGIYSNRTPTAPRVKGGYSLPARRNTYHHM